MAGPLAARAQIAMPVIGFLSGRSQDESAGDATAFRRGLNEMGFVEGQNLAIEYRWAESRNERLPELAADLVRRHVAVIAAPGGPMSALAAKAATTTIPIVFNVGDDPVRSGLVASLAGPGGNMTGVNFLSTELAAKRLELLRELVPGAARVAVLVNPVNVPNTELTLRDMEPAARRVGLQYQVLNVDTPREIDAAFESLGRDRPDALRTSADVRLESAMRSKADVVTPLSPIAILISRKVCGDVNGLVRPPRQRRKSIEGFHGP